MIIKRSSKEHWPRMVTLQIHGEEELSAEVYSSLRSGEATDVDDNLATFLITSGYCTEAQPSAAPPKDEGE